MAQIKTEEQYKAACERINELLKVVSNETPAGDKNLLELDMISDLVADYEELHFPVVSKEEMERERISFKELFETCPFLNVTAFAEWIGINPSLMRQYKRGQYISEKQVSKIQTAIHKIGKELLAVQLV
jgi:HTH-type transcriptional regulator/antitoxin HigA